MSRRSAGGGGAGTAVAAGVHAGGQGQRALEGVLQHRDEEAPEPADPARGASAQRLRGPDPTGAVGQLREDRDGHDQCRADLVERGRHRLEQPLGVGQRVGGADADDDRGEAETVVEAGEQALAGERTEQADPGDPVGQRHGSAGRAARGRRPRRRTRSGTPPGSPRSRPPATGRAGTTAPTAWSERRACTTTAATATSSSRSSGLVVSVAAAARPRAHTHQATGCRSRARRVLTAGRRGRRRAATAIGGDRRHEDAQDGEGHPGGDAGRVLGGVHAVGRGGRVRRGRAVGPGVVAVSLRRSGSGSA